MGQLVFKATQQPAFAGTAVFIAPPPADVFVETGTCYGETLSNAVGVETFKECHSIECYTPAYLNMARRFLHEPRAKIYFGSSPDVLPSVIDPKQSTLFWLDAHYVPDFGQYEGHGVPVIDKYGQCPLLAELDAITACNWEAPAYILIDDAHLFTDEFWLAEGKTDTLADGKVLDDIVYVGSVGFLRKGLKREDWPTLAQITAKLPRHRLEVTQNVIMGVPIG